ncbi:hypothetical protein [Streptomyces sp. NBC_01443]|uniref:hypothetical protein n=1 Tax=Streptomyces sp. NBC_01443 TaxID=2903868 RepID=UPI0022505DD7|nr:hypothetical protein [Streptomyces sp. NBC_01443]MCX4633092.1 hypothetical protein [Streptomyces sp. NBC_01443]
MASSLSAARAIDFLCEHTASKSRVMALLAHDNGPSSLTAVLTCKDPDHAYEAVGILRRVLARRDATTVEDELKALTAEMADAPASSLRQAVVQAASGSWTAGVGALFVVPEPEPDTSEDDPATEALPGPVGHPRLKDLPGKVVRITHLHEFHITDEDALLRAAVDSGWEPLPASELGDDDPRDLIGAVMTLTEDPDIAGAETLEDQSSAELLSPEDGDELADWSTRPVVARFTHGWRLREQRTRPATEVRTPNFAALFATQDCPCKGEDENCEKCGWQLTPRTADLLHMALVVLADQAYDDAERLGDQFLSDADSATWEVFDRLPSFTWTADHRWRRRMARAFDDLAGDLAKGNWPCPTCTAEEMALHLAIEDAPMHLEDRPEEDDHNSLPEHEDDYSWGSCSDLLFQDHDVLMLFHTQFSGIEDPENPTNQSMGIGDLREAAWFTPFGSRSIRDPRRGFRR